MSETNPYEEDSSRPSDSSWKEQGEERILKDTQGVVFKRSLISLQGSLVLTNKRLLFIVGDRWKRDDGLPPLMSTSLSDMGTNQSDKEDSSSNDIPDNTNNFSIPLDRVESTVGRKGILKNTLFVRIRDQVTDELTTLEFNARVRPPSLEDPGNIDNWASWIEKAQTSTPEEFENTYGEKSTQPSGYFREGLDHMIMDLLDDEEWKGLFQMGEELSLRYNESIDVDEIESACKALVKQKLVEEDDMGEFFRKRTTEQ